MKHIKKLIISCVLAGSMLNTAPAVQADGFWTGVKAKLANAKNTVVDKFKNMSPKQKIELRNRIIKLCIAPVAIAGILALNKYANPKILNACKSTRDILDTYFKATDFLKLNGSAPSTQLLFLPAAIGLALNKNPQIAETIKNSKDLIDTYTKVSKFLGLAF